MSDFSERPCTAEERQYDIAIETARIYQDLCWPSYEAIQMGCLYAGLEFNDLNYQELKERL